MRYLALGLIACSVTTYALERIASSDAINHVGENATVCGVVASAKYASSSRGQPTFLNLDRRYPNHVFTALVWGESRDRFGYAPESLSGERICVTGQISTFRGVAQIVVSSESQIEPQ